MPVSQTSQRDRLRSGLLGPLGQEVTDMLMEELDQRGLRTYIDERFQQVDKRFERLEAKIDHLATEFRDAVRPSQAIVYTVCGTIALVAVTALVTVLIDAFSR